MIVTFYSFKGGVGRSMAMAAVGYLLAQRGLKVLVIDFDLEAPGLERYFFDEPGVLATVRSNPGLMDFVLTYKRALTSTAEFERADFKQWTKYIVDAIPQTPSGGSVDLMTSGCRYPQERYAEYALFVRSFDWQDFFHNWRGDRFFEWLRRELTSSDDGYDVVLVDSRTGVTEMGGVCAYQLADVAVLLCAPNYQNLDGTRAVLDDFRSDSVTALRQGRPLDLLVVPARVEQSDPVKRDRFFADFEGIFGSDGLPRVLADAGVDYRRLAIPYDQDLAIIERLVDDTTVRSGALASHSAARASFEVLADAVALLATGSGRWEQLRQDAFARLRTGDRHPESLPIADLSKRGSGYDVFLEYCADDREEGERLRDLLTGRGLEVWTPIDVAPGVVPDTTVARALQYSETVVFGVGRGPASPWFWSILKAAQERRKRIVPVLLPGSRPDDDLDRHGLSGYQSIDLRRGLDDSVALDTLVQAVGRQAPPDASPNLVVRRPYPGVLPFVEDDSTYFCGREQDAERLLAAVAAHDVLLLTGASCVGKTSLVQAGLLPQLRAGLLSTAGPEGSPLTAIVIDCAADAAAAELERATNLPADVAALVVLDSIDTFPRDGSLRAPTGLIDRIAALLDGAGPRRRFLLVWRGAWPRSQRDALIAAWSRAVPLHEMRLEPLDAAGLRKAMEQPAAKTGHLFEPGLVDRVIQDAGTQPGAIAQVQIVLSDLWNARRRGWLTNKAYDASRGIAGRFTQRLEAFLLREDAPAREAVAAMLRSMVYFDAQLSPFPRPQPWHTLASIPKLQHVDAVALRDRMIAERLIDLWPGLDGEGLCGIAQPASGTLVDGIARGEPEFILWRQRFGSYVSGYLQSGRPSHYTMPTDALNEAEGWSSTHREELSGDEQAVIESSLLARHEEEEAARRLAEERIETARVVEQRDRANAERARAQREAERADAERQRAEAAARVSRRRTKIAGGLLAVVVVLSVSVVWVAFRLLQQTRAERARLAGESFQEAAARLEQEQPAEALAFLADSLRLDPANDAARSLALSVLLNGRWPRWVPWTDGPVLALGWSPDSKHLLTATRSNARVMELSALSAGTLGMEIQFGSNAGRAIWSPDGGHVATLSDLGTVQIWNAQTGQAAGKLLAHGQPVIVIAWRPDGRQIATGSNDGHVRLWSASGDPLAGLITLGAPVNAIAWSPTGDRIATGDANRVRAWKPALKDEPPIGTLEFETAVQTLGWSADGRTILAVGDDGTTAVLDLATRKVQRANKTKQFNGRVRSDAWNPGSGTFAMGFETGAMSIWRPGEEPATVHPPHGAPVSALAWSPSGTLLAVAAGPSVELLNTRTWQPVGETLLHERAVTAVAWSGDGRLLATADDRTTRVWDAGVTRPAGTLLPHEGYVVAAAWNPVKPSVATASWDGTARLWKADTGEETKKLEHKSSVLDVSWSADGTRLATASSDGHAAIWNDAGSEILKLTAGAAAAVTAVEWNRRGDLLATVSDDLAVRIWRPATGELAHTPLQHPAPVLAIAWSPDGQQLATAADDGVARIWNVTGGNEPIRTFQHDGSVFAVAWNPKGRWFATGSTESAARVWDLSSPGSNPQRLNHGGAVRALAWSPDGLWLATGSADHAARVWRTSSWQPVGKPLVHEDAVTSIAWSPDGHRLATGSSDSTARVWDALSGRPLGTPLKHRSLVVSVQWSQNGERLLTASWDNAARIWDIPHGADGNTDDLITLAEATGGMRVESGQATGPGARRLPILIRDSDADPETESDSPEKWKNRLDTRDRLHQKMARTSTTPESLDGLLRWFFDDPYSRTISPLSSVTVPMYTRRLIERGGDAIEEMWTSFPALLSIDAGTPASLHGRSSRAN